MLLLEVVDHKVVVNEAICGVLNHLVILSEKLALWLEEVQVWVPLRHIFLLALFVDLYLIEQRVEKLLHVLQAYFFVVLECFVLALG